MKRAFTKNSFKHFFLLIALSVIGFTAKAQPAAAYADPAVGSFDITNMGDVSVPASNLMSNSVYKLKLIIFNVDQINPIPDGTCQIQIGLGTRLTVDPLFNLATAAYSNYFTWTTGLIGTQVQIYGTLHTPLPNDWVGQLSFNVRAKDPTYNNVTSTVSANFSVSNNNPAFNFSDLNPNNNNASLQYTIFFQSNIPVPVTLTAFSALNKNCGIDLKWNVAQELNFSHYEVEMSKDGINYFTVATIAGQNKTEYTSRIAITDAIKAPLLYARLKCVDLDGTFKYSKVVTVGGTCNSTASTSVYSFPNPVRRNGDVITIARTGGAFNGTYQLVLSDMVGKIHAVKTVTLNNVGTFKYETGAVPASGQYMLRIAKTDGSDNNVIRFEKL